MSDHDKPQSSPQDPADRPNADDVDSSIAPGDTGSSDPAAEAPATDSTAADSTAAGSAAAGSANATDSTADASVESTDDVPREPSKYELDATSKGSDSAGTPPAAPPIDVDDDEAPKQLPPSKWASIFLGALAALLLGFGFLTLAQDAKALHDSAAPELKRSQVAVVAQYLEDDGALKLSDDELKSAQDAWEKNGNVDEPTGDNLAPIFNDAITGTDKDQVTAQKIDELIKDKGQTLTWTTADIQSSLNNQLIMFMVGGAIAAIALIFYRQRKAWARFLGMFISGLAGIMFLMQVVQGGLNIFSIVLTIAGIGAFYFLMKGRLVEAPAAAGFGGAGRGGGGQGGLGGFGGFGGFLGGRRRDPNQ